ncbi:MAG: GTP cyclohydrolase I FolE2 [Candidatus Methanomethylophilaceae archaeon]|nr:GTP cyclohydrolase I FolE2 [Candidatus Methanomethylophilaceae archaeon]MBR7124819.1 GTP cyclohydrolase I FolE2 [Candidatus Methanomethylophilaceae archaeon]
MIPVCDVQNSKGDSGFMLSKVGVTGVRKPVCIKRAIDGNDLNGMLFCSIDVFVDLPAVQKGSHLSRNLEAIREVVDDSIATPVTGIENLAVDICKKLLVKHEYASEANVKIEAEYFKDTSTPNGRKTMESYKLIGKAKGIRDCKIRKTLGVEVIGMTACPCAQQTVTEILEYPAGWPVMSHNQRNVCTVIMDMDENYDVEANGLIELIESGFSSPTFELLKRDDEGAVVINAHRNPKFVEDVVRGVLIKLVDAYKDLPDDVGIIVRSESEESIHKHNAFAERSCTLGALRNE